jgi:hypothetical protein
MAAEREVVGEAAARGGGRSTERGESGRSPATVGTAGESAGTPAGRPADIRRRLPRSTVIWCLVVAVVLGAWFLVAWLALDRHVIDAAGESVGSAFFLLLVASVVGAIRRGRR